MSSTEPSPSASRPPDPAPSGPSALRAPASLCGSVLGIVRVAGDAGASAAHRGRRWGGGKRSEEAEGGENPERAGKRGSQYASSSHWSASASVPLAGEADNKADLDRSE